MIYAMVNDIDATLTALAEPTRRRVVELLRERPCPAGELAARATMSAPAMSRHLRVLRLSGLVDEERDARDARLRIYRLRPEPFVALRGWLEHMQEFWTDQMAAFKEYVERTRGEETE
jgi:DNA-binding transcriptional ArsR family regulator